MSGEPTHARPCIPRSGADARKNLKLSVLSHPNLTIGEKPCPADETVSALREVSRQLSQAREHFLGFPGNMAFDDSDSGHLLATLANNVGDPDSEDASGMHTKDFEREVIAWFTELAQGDPGTTYGYVTSGGSEGVTFGLYVGREQFEHAPLYASSQAHYSVRKASELLRMRLVSVPCGPDGTMDAEALGALCRTQRREDAAAGRPPRGAVVLATAGTTMGGAFDDVPALREAAGAAGPCYVHCDAALGGIVAAFSSPRPPWNFRDGADSVSVSGHKFLGAPVPCGIVLARRSLLPSSPVGEYVGTRDHTLACSRSGLATVLLWKRLRQLGTSGLRDLVHRCQDTAEYAKSSLTAVGARPQRQPHALTVTFDRPPEEVRRRWRLSVEGERAQLIAMPHVTRRVIDELCADWSPAGERLPLPPCRVVTARNERAHRPGPAAAQYGTG
ncbi:histidine decarboxylase [Streptomyces oryzae]|uniref:Histidine decarboxylase n=1 Tax=Streptomyces oryzae TaxID=1434886 RepID=A0ABS3X834_9ACTN|nr:histidine decarboxylase [Streptomyces oryzae]